MYQYAKIILSLATKLERKLIHVRGQKLHFFSSYESSILNIKILVGFWTEHEEKMEEE
jgi:hypothetical protein